MRSMMDKETLVNSKPVKMATQLDIKLSYKIYSATPKTSTVASILKTLEYSCHGIPWFAIVLIALYLWPQNKWTSHLLIGLMLDVIYVAVGKAYARRRRPQYAPQDDQFVVASVDKHSFPSGHASRAIYVALFFTQSSTLVALITWVWAISVCISRVLLGRHHLLDVLVGILLGYLEYSFQFGFGSILCNSLAWLISSALGVQFSDTNDMGDGEIPLPVD